MNSPYLLSEADAAFIASGNASIALAARDGYGRASVAKCAGCRVSADRRRVTLLLDQHYAAAVVRDLRAGSPVAAVFSEPATHRTLQLKSPAAELGNVTPADREHARQYTEAIVAHIAPLGYSEAGLRCYFAHAPEQLVAVTFTPTVAYDQTPGPQAGGRLQAGDSSRLPAGGTGPRSAPR
jgi:hypothetical protein